MPNSRRLRGPTTREIRIASSGVPHPERQVHLPGADFHSRQNWFERLYFVGSRYHGYALVEAARSAANAPPRPDSTPGGFRFPEVMTFEDPERMLARAKIDLRRPAARRVTNQLFVLDRGTLGDQVRSVAQAVRKSLPDATILLLTDTSEGRFATLQIPDRNLVDRVAVWDGRVEDLAAMVWLLQDQRSSEEDRERGVPVILLVEDEPEIYGRFLPIIYRELLLRARQLLPMEATEAEIRRSMDHRPRLLLAENFEEALLILGRFTGHLIGVITDLQFPVGREVQVDAGYKLGEVVRVLRPAIPLILQSEAEKAPPEVARLPAFYLSKSSETWLPNLRRIMLDYFGFGDFVFRLPSGEAIGAASTLQGLRDQIATIPLESLVYHGRRNHVSTWLYIHGGYEMAQRIRPLHGEDESARRRIVAMLDEFTEDSRGQNASGVADAGQDGTTGAD